MNLLDPVLTHCGILVGPGEGAGFVHWGTAWAVGRGEWITAWADDQKPPADLRLMTARDGTLADIGGWEADMGIAGFKSIDLGSHLSAGDGDAGALHKRDRLCAMGYPSMIDHPAFRLHAGSLTAERYYPYLCPWVIDGHLALFTADFGYLAGRFYAGMRGAPVLNERQEVVGVLLDGHAADDQPPLARFRRLA